MSNIKSNCTPYQPACVFAHDLVNKLAVIVGICDLLSARLGQDVESIRRLALIRDIASSTAKDLATHPCSPTETARSGETQRDIIASVSSLPGGLL